jgi:hypothetical protein
LAMPVRKNRQWDFQRPAQRTEGRASYGEVGAQERKKSGPLKSQSHWPKTSVWLYARNPTGPWELLGHRAQKRQRVVGGSRAQRGKRRQDLPGQRAQERRTTVGIQIAQRKRRPWILLGQRAQEQRKMIGGSRAQRGKRQWARSPMGQQEFSGQKAQEQRGA